MLEALGPAFTRKNTKLTQYISVSEVVCDVRKNPPPWCHTLYSSLAEGNPQWRRLVGETNVSGLLQGTTSNAVLSSRRGQRHAPISIASTVEIDRHPQGRREGSGLVLAFQPTEIHHLYAERQHCSTQIRIKS